MTTLHEAAQRNAKPTRPVLLLTLLMVILLWVGSLPVALACGDPPSNESDLAERGMRLKDVTQGSLLFKTHETGRFTPAPLLKTDVKISISGVIARTTVAQEFVNPSRRKNAWAEGLYVFPLPETAAVDHLRMKVGERTIIGEIRERAEAKSCLLYTSDAADERS